MEAANSGAVAIGSVSGRGVGLASNGRGIPCRELRSHRRGEEEGEDRGGTLLDGRGIHCRWEEEGDGC